MVSDGAVLMSIRPPYANAILDGIKTVELRRRRPSFPPGTEVLIYSTAPEQRVSGTFITGRVLSDPPETLWWRVAERAGVARAVFDSYFTGCDTAYAIEIVRPCRISPRTLALRPPQSYLLLRPEEPRHGPLLGLLRGSREAAPPARRAGWWLGQLPRAVQTLVRGVLRGPPRSSGI